MICAAYTSFQRERVEFCCWSVRSGKVDRSHKHTHIHTHLTQFVFGLDMVSISQLSISFSTNCILTGLFFFVHSRTKPKNEETRPNKRRRGFALRTFNLCFRFTLTKTIISLLFCTLLVVSTHVCFPSKKKSKSSAMRNSQTFARHMKRTATYDRSASADSTFLSV